MVNYHTSFLVGFILMNLAYLIRLSNLIYKGLDYDLFLFGLGLAFVILGFVYSSSWDSLKKRKISIILILISEAAYLVLLWIIDKQQSVTPLAKLFY